MQNMPTWKVEVDFTGGAVGGPYVTFDDPARGRLDIGKFAPTGTLFTDVSQYVRGLSWSNGASRFDAPYRRADAGSLTVVLDNSLAQFDPTNLDGPFVLAGVTQVQPRRVVRVRALWNGTYYDVWRGFVDSWNLNYPLSGKDATVTLHATDVVKILANYDGPEMPSVGAGEGSSARIQRIATNAGVDPGDVFTTPDASSSNFVEPSYQGTTLSQNAWAELELTSDVAYGELFVDKAGHLVFRDRNHFATGVTYVFSGGADGGLVMDEPQFTHDDTQIYNLVRVTAVGGTEQLVEDTTSQSAYLTRTFSRSDFTNDSDPLWTLPYAQFVLSQYKDPHFRFESFGFKPRSSSGHVVAALSLDFGDRVTVRWTPPGRDDPIERDCFIRGASHTVTPQGEWSVVYAVEDATSYNVLVFDDPALGRFDFNRFGFGLTLFP